ncbi:MAG TPA: hypothetical protein VD867_10970 [Burkholderiales bacterium]|nr:hypothetical protein [Burkholderiales bacterium]
MPTLKGINGRTMSLLRALGAYSTRERQHLLSEMTQVKGLMPLLMKPRNKQRWTSEEKAELQVHLSRLSRLSPYLVVVVMPGGLFLLPALAWWLDRRRNRNPSTPRPPT